MPFRIDNRFNAVAVWSKQSAGGTFGYAGQLWKYLQSHGSDIKDGECLLIGDLNSNVRWDRPDRWWNHSDNVQILDGMGLKSIYHEQEGLEQGSENQPTFFLYRHRDRSYHIDYVFSSDGLRNGCELKCHDPEHWLQFSDHVPLELELAAHWQH